MKNTLPVKNVDTREQMSKLLYTFVFVFDRE